MLGINQLIGFGGGRKSALLYDIIVELGLTTNLSLCLDVADLNSYSGTGQTWTDVAGANDYFRGISGSANASDPTFNGTAGVADENTYWSFDGADYFDETADHTFADEWHKNNGVFSFIFGMYVIGTTDRQCLFTTDAFGGALNTMSIELSATEAPSVQFNDATAYAAGHNCTTSSWNIFGGSYAEASTNIDWNVNGNASSDTTSAKTSTFTPGDTSQLMSNNGTSGIYVVPSGTRLAFVALWNGTIGPTALQSLYSTLKSRRLPSAP